MEWQAAMPRTVAQWSPCLAPAGSLRGSWTAPMPGALHAGQSPPRERRHRVTRGYAWHRVTRGCALHRAAQGDQRLCQAQSSTDGRLRPQELIPQHRDPRSGIRPPWLPGEDAPDVRGCPWNGTQWTPLEEWAALWLCFRLPQRLPCCSGGS